tara:strand:+ start:465 stop:734 length:270 start_codon:yes stop_codon:yes gene_type:complete
MHSAGIIIITPNGPALTPDGKQPEPEPERDTPLDLAKLRAIVAKLHDGGDAVECAGEIEALLGDDDSADDDGPDKDAAEGEAPDGNPFK